MYHWHYQFMQLSLTFLVLFKGLHDTNHRMPSSCPLPLVWSTLCTPDQSSTLLDNVPHISALLSYFMHHWSSEPAFRLDLPIFDHLIIQYQSETTQSQIDTRVDSRGLFKCTIRICVMSIVIGFPQTSADNSTNHKSGNTDKKGKRALAGYFCV